MNDLVFVYRYTVYTCCLGKRQYETGSPNTLCDCLWFLCGSCSADLSEQPSTPTHAPTHTHTHTHKHTNTQTLSAEPQQL